MSNLNLSCARDVHPKVAGDLVYKLKKIVGTCIFSVKFDKIMSHYKNSGNNINVLQQTALLVTLLFKSAIRVRNTMKPSTNFLIDCSKKVLVLWILFVICVSCLSCHIVLSVLCNLVVTCLEKTDLLTHMCVLVSCVYVTFPHGVLNQVWCLIFFIPGIWPWVGC